MNQRKHLTLVAAGASLLGTLPLEAVFEEWTWLVDAFLITVALGAVALLLRGLRAPVWAPTLGMLAATLLVLTWIFPPPGGSIIPTTKTFTNFNTLLQQAGTDMTQYAAPVPDRPGFLFLSTLGVAGVVIVIDLFAVVLRRPALAGLPMLAIYSVPVAVKDDSVSMIPFLLGAGGFLWLLVTDNVDRVRRFGRRFTGDGRDVDLWEPSPLAAAGWRLGIFGLVLAVVLPFLMPGMTSGGLLTQWAGGTGVGVTGGKGRGTSVGLFAELTGELNRDKSTELVKVTNLNDNAPPYLRFGVADQLNNAGFSERPQGGGSTLGDGIPAPQNPDDYSSTLYRAQVEVTSFNENYLPDYVYTTKIDKLGGSWQYDPNSAMIYSDRDSTKGKKYTIEYRKPTYTAEQLRAVKDLPSSNPVQRQFSTVPPNDGVRDTVNRLINGKTNEYDKVLAIYDSFAVANGFTYDRTTGGSTGGTAIESFLKNKRGFCVQFAAGMAWLVRQAKYPSRVAFGFTRGTSKQGNTFTLTNFNLHAWTEVYFQGYGWVPFDATPAASVGGSVSPEWAPNPSAPIDLGNNENDKIRPGLNPSAGPGASAAAQAPNQAGNHDGGSAANPALFVLTWRFYVSVLGMVLLVLALLSAAITRGVVRQRRLKYGASLAARAGQTGVRPPGDGPPDPGAGLETATVEGLPPGQIMVAARDDWLNEAVRVDAHQAWDELLDTMVDYRVPVNLAETPRTTLERVTTSVRLKEGPQLAMRRVSTAEEFARYSRAPVLDVALHRSVVELRHSFAARADRSTRIRAALLPPSVTNRWRAATGRRLADFSNLIGRGWYAVTTSLSVRRRMRK